MRFLQVFPPGSAGGESVPRALLRCSPARDAPPLLAETRRWCSPLQPYTLNPELKSYLKPYTLNPKPEILHPQPPPETQHPQLKTLNTPPNSLNPAPQPLVDSPPLSRPPPPPLLHHLMLRVLPWTVSALWYAPSAVHMRKINEIRDSTTHMLTLNVIAVSIYDRYSVGPSIRPTCTKCCPTITNMIQVCSGFHRAGEFIINTRPDEIGCVQGGTQTANRRCSRPGIPSCSPSPKTRRCLFSVLLGQCVRLKLRDTVYEP